MKLGSLVPWRERSEPAVRDDAYDPLTAFRRDVDRMFDDFFTGIGTPAVRSWSGSVNPTIDATETDKEVVITTELPGLDDKDFEVTLTGENLPGPDGVDAFVVQRQVVGYAPAQFKRLDDDRVMLTFDKSEYLTAAPMSLDLVVTDGVAPAVHARSVTVPFAAVPSGP